jgi:hypothetical protein
MFHSSIMVGRILTYEVSNFRHFHIVVLERPGMISNCIYFICLLLIIIAFLPNSK